MKKLILFLILVFILFVAYNRQRLYLRDPFGSVTHNGVKENGTQVFINYSNDVLLENDHTPAYIKIIQHDNHIGIPTTLKCVHFLVCLADANPVTLLLPETNATVESMDAKAINLKEGKQQTTISLR
jgi:hypothetical protein